jgi:hypothetical protein
MTAIEATGIIAFPSPVLGQPIAAGEALPSPVTPERDSDHHTIKLFTSEHPEFGDEVDTLYMKLHGEVYLDQGFIDETKINPIGLYKDEYTARSTHFYAINGRKIAGARQIKANKADRVGYWESLPTAQKFSIDPEVLKKVAGVEHLSDLKRDEVVEISGLVSRRKEDGDKGGGDLDAVIALYSQMVATSLEKGHKLWLLNVDPAFQRRLSMLLGAERVHTLGEKQKYIGPETVPIALSPAEIVRHVLSSEDPASLKIRQHFNEVFPGVNDRRIPKDICGLLKANGIETKHYPEALKMLASRKALGYAAIMGYSAFRAIPASGVDEFTGSVAALWGIDVVTAAPYTWGLMETFSGRTIPRRVIGALTAVATFIAPYAYFYKQGNVYPPGVNAAVAAFVGIAVASNMISRRTARKRDAKIANVLQSVPEGRISSSTA